MRRARTSRWAKPAGVVLAAALVALFLPASAEACATCFGDPDSPMTHGLNKGILTLLGFIALVQVGIVRVAWTMRKRAREQAAASVSDTRKG